MAWLMARPHADVLEHRRRRVVQGVHLQEGDAHGLAADDLQVRHRLQLLGLVRRHVHDEVEPAREHLGDLRLAVGDDADLDPGDLGGRAEIVRVALERDRLAEHVLHDAVGARADRLLVHALGADRAVVLVGMDHHRAREVLERRGRRLLGDDADLVGVELLGALDPAHVLLRDGFVGGVRDEVQRVDDVVGRELLAVVEFHAAAQVELERPVVDDAPRRREVGLVLPRVGIAVDQRVPDLVAQDDAEADVVEVGIDVLDRLVIGEAQGVAALVGGGRCRGERRKKDQAGEEPSIAHATSSERPGREWARSSPGVKRRRLAPCAPRRRARRCPTTRRP
jgi:hypothetical protein